MWQVILLYKKGSESLFCHILLSWTARGVLSFAAECCASTFSCPHFLSNAPLDLVTQTPRTLQAVDKEIYSSWAAQFTVRVDGK